jgi:hypothetical protein
VRSSNKTPDSSDPDSKTKTVNGIKRKVESKTSKVNIDISDKLQDIFQKGSARQRQSTENSFRNRNSGTYTASDSSGYHKNKNSGNTINPRFTAGQNFNTGGGGKQQPRGSSAAGARTGTGAGGAPKKPTPPPKSSVQRGRVQAVSECCQIDSYLALHINESCYLIP